MKSRLKMPVFGMKWKILGAFAVFTLLVLVILWVAQIYLLDDIYSAIRLRETRRAVDSVYASLESDDADGEANRISAKYDLCISVYRIQGNKGTLILRAHTVGDCLIHNIAGDSLLGKMYLGAKEKSYYTESLSAKQTFGDFPDTILMSHVTETDRGDVMITVNAEIAPVNATVRTLTVLLGYITAVLIVFAALLALVLAKRLARPIVSMKEEAALLARGNYGVHFVGTGSAETVELAATLNYAASELSKIDRMQRELIANISHDLRTPLTMISGYSEVIRDIPGEATPENMQVIIDETDRLAALVGDMLDLSRLTSGTRHLKREYFDLAEAVSETLKRYKKLKERDGYTFITEGLEYAPVLADRAAILQVLYNLINNAINYSGEDRTVVIRESIKNGRVRIDIIDRGDGIPEDRLPLIWERYYRASEFHRRGVTGTGLGLSIVKNILTLHASDFGVVSKPGEGSDFWFELELEGGTAKAPPTAFPQADR